MLRVLTGQPGNGGILCRVKLRQPSIWLSKRAGFDDVGHHLGLTTCFWETSILLGFFFDVPAKTKQPKLYEFNKIFPQLIYVQKKKTSINYLVVSIKTAHSVLIHEIFSTFRSTWHAIVTKIMITSPVVTFSNISYFTVLFIFPFTNRLIDDYKF